MRFLLKQKESLARVKIRIAGDCPANEVQGRNFCCDCINYGIPLSLRTCARNQYFQLFDIITTISFWLLNYSLDVREIDLRKLSINAIRHEELKYENRNVNRHLLK